MKKTVIKRIVKGSLMQSLLTRKIILKRVTLYFLQKIHLLLDTIKWRQDKYKIMSTNQI